MTTKVYCSVAQLSYDLKLKGSGVSETALLQFCQSASKFIDRKIGEFIPTVATRVYDGTGYPRIYIDPFTALTSVTQDGTLINSAQYLKIPRQPMWENGCYTGLEVDPDATQLTVWHEEAGNLEIAGEWGKYSETAITGVTVQNTTQIAAGGTSLLVSDGSKISIGHVLKIESEQLLVTATGAVTDSTSNTSEAIAATDEEFDATGTLSSLLNMGEIIRINNEDMQVLAIIGSTVYVARGWNGTEIVSHLTGQDIYVYRTFTVQRGINGTTDAAHLNGTVIYKYIPPDDINWLARQIAGLMKKKADSGFAGKTGNAELGEIFYTDEFPKRQIEEIARAYRIVRL